MTFEEILLQFKIAKPLLLLRVKNAAFIVSFFQKVFADANITTIANAELRSKLRLEWIRRPGRFIQNDTYAAVG